MEAGGGRRCARWEWQRLWRRGTPVNISGCFKFLRFFARGGTGGRGQLRRLWGEAVNVLACGWKLRTGEGLLYGLLWAGPFSPVILGCAGRDCLKLAHARDGPGLSLRIASGRIALPMSKYKNSGSGGQDARPPQKTHTGQRRGRFSDADEPRAVSPDWRLWPQELGVGSWELGVRSQESGVRRQETGGRRRALRERGAGWGWSEPGTTLECYLTPEKYALYQFYRWHQRE